MESLDIESLIIRQFFFFYLDLIYSRILQKFELNSQIKYHT